MTQSVTTSIRLPTKLREQLENAAYTLHHGKNWIIVQALEEYLGKLNQKKLIADARKQSLLASQKEEDDAWESNTDTSGWK